MGARLRKALQAPVLVPRWLWPALWFLCAFWIGGSLPIWDDWFRDGQNVTFDYGTLWSLVAHLPETGLRAFWHRHSGDVGRIVVLLLVSGGPLAYCLLVRRPKRPDAAGDYADGPGGAVLDGRASALVADPAAADPGAAAGRAGGR